MSKASFCRLILDPPACGAWNMAVDEALLTAAVQENEPTLRFYQWQRPTLSLGYFQPHADRAEHQPSLGADVVRRLSGGGAILHDREVTYSLVLPSSHPMASDIQILYQVVHEVIIRYLNDVLCAADLPWRLAVCRETFLGNSQEEPFLCFQRRSPGDVLLQPQGASSTKTVPKIVGSAQRRRRGAVLQHGSLLLSKSALAPELLGLNDVAKVDLSAEETLRKLPLAIAHQLQLDLQPPTRSACMALGAKELVQQRYGNRHWSKRR